MIDNNPTIKNVGYDFDYFEIFALSSQILVLSTTQNGTLKINGETTLQGKSYDSYSKFNYLPNFLMDCDRIEFQLISGEKQIILLIIVNEGYQLSYIDHYDGVLLLQYLCREYYHPRYDSRSICLTESIKGNYYLETDNFFHKCDISYDECNIKSNYCTKCATDYIKNPYIEYNCYYLCTNKFYIDEKYCNFF